jgi:hypothetical protein
LYQLVGLVDRTEESNFNGSQCLPAPVDDAISTRTLNRSATRSQGSLNSNAHEAYHVSFVITLWPNVLPFLDLARQWKVSVHSEDAVNPPLLQV